MVSACDQHGTSSGRVSRAAPGPAGPSRQLQASHRAVCVPNLCVFICVHRGMCVGVGKFVYLCGHSFVCVRAYIYVQVLTFVWVRVCAHVCMHGRGPCCPVEDEAGIHAAPPFVPAGVWVSGGQAQAGGTSQSLVFSRTGCDLVTAACNTGRAGLVGVRSGSQEASPQRGWASPGRPRGLTAKVGKGSWAGIRHCQHSPSGGALGAFSHYPRAFGVCSEALNPHLLG